MATKGISAFVGMQITGHKLEGAYQHYDQSSETCVRVAHEIVREGRNYITNIQVETQKMKQALEGREADEANPTKKHCVEVGGNSG